MEYKKRRDSAILSPDEYLSIIVDVVDQSSYGIPRFMVKTKKYRGHSMKVRLLGLLQHAVPHKLHLYSMTEGHSTGANHIIEAILLTVTYIIRKKGKLPRRLFLQFDNCTRENKNRFLFPYLQSIVQMSIFDEIILGFSPVGNTHEDIDQSFSCLLYTSPSPRDQRGSRMPSSA